MKREAFLAIRRGRSDEADGVPARTGLFFAARVGRPDAGRVTLSDALSGVDPMGLETVARPAGTDRIACMFIPAPPG